LLVPPVSLMPLIWALALMPFPRSIMLFWKVAVPPAMLIPWMRPVPLATLRP
jgi:hypothetical protein